MGYDDTEFDDYEWDVEQGFLEDTTGQLDEDEEADELETYGIDRFEFDMMDDEEKREALEEAGLDPDDFADEFLI